jgi:hypothetical protein
MNCLESNPVAIAVMVVVFVGMSVNALSEIELSVHRMIEEYQTLTIFVRAVIRIFSFFTIVDEKQDTKDLFWVMSALRQVLTQCQTDHDLALSPVLSRSLSLTTLPIDTQQSLSLFIEIIWKEIRKIQERLESLQQDNSHKNDVNRQLQEDIHRQESSISMLKQQQASNEELLRHQVRETENKNKSSILN